MIKWLSLILDILCAIFWTVELITYCVTGTIAPVIIIVALIITIFFFIQLALFDFPKK
jgi:multidrug transporter EmrE-like cation transporter